MGLYLPGMAHAMLSGLQRAQQLRRSKRGFGLGLWRFCAEDLSACQVRHTREKEEILRETWWSDVLGTGTFHLISVDEFNILFPSMSSTDLVIVWIDPYRRLSGKAARCTRIPTGVVRHRLMMDCSGQEGLSDRSLSTSTLLYSVDSVEMIGASFMPDFLRH